ncbi:S41 family peptidase [Candidatus Avelusimicrobium facis]|uniref:S41 family peptidase n=1 Tax=Candidatus Avelusimicrobium facis TaxID=3416203 RepID=UPI003D0D5B9A
MNNKYTTRWVAVAAAVFFVGTLFPYAYSAADSGLKKLRTFINVLEYVKENYVETMDSDTLITGAIRGVVDELDDFSQYLDPKDYKNLKNDTRGDFGGLGIRLSKVDGFVTVMSPMPNTPAFAAGVMPGDRVLRVDGKEISGMELDEAVELMRGPVGSKVHIVMSRKNTKTGTYEELPEYHFKRQKIVPEVVYFRMLKDKIGYIYLVDFSGHSTEEVKKALKQLSKQGMKALVLDLRFNPGGLLNGAADIAKLFMGQHQTVVYTQGRKPEFYQEFKTDATADYPDLPMAVLINQGSASASEIVSGALQDNDRAVIIGQRSFGKASVQQVMPLDGGAGLRLTIAKYYTPKGRLIQRNYRDKSKEKEGGIFPDVEVKVDPQEEAKVFMQYNNVVYTPGKAQPKVEFKEKDPVLDQAVKILKEGPEKIIAKKAELEKAAREQAEQEAGAAQQAKQAQTAQPNGSRKK